MRPHQFPGDVLPHIDKPPVTVEEHQRIMDAYDAAERVIQALTARKQAGRYVHPETLSTAIEEHRKAEQAALQISEELVTI